MAYTEHFRTKTKQSKTKTPQSQPIPGKKMVANSAGGYSFAVDKWTGLQRFLILGAEGGTYYLCARDKYGGPPKVGDLFGRYDMGTVEPSAVIVDDDETVGDVDIVVHTVW